MFSSPVGQQRLSGNKQNFGVTGFHFLTNVSVELAEKVMFSRHLGPDDLCMRVFVDMYACASERVGQLPLVFPLFVTFPGCSRAAAATGIAGRSLKFWQFQISCLHSSDRPHCLESVCHNVM